MYRICIVYVSYISANNLHKVTMLPNAVVFYTIHFHTTTLSHKKNVDILGGRTYPVRYYPIALRLRDRKGRAFLCITLNP